MENNEVEFCRKCLEPIKEGDQTYSISNIFVKAKYHLECYKKNRKFFKRSFVTYFIIVVVLFLIGLGAILGLFFGLKS